MKHFSKLEFSELAAILYTKGWFPKEKLNEILGDTLFLDPLFIDTSKLDYFYRKLFLKLAESKMVDTNNSQIAEYILCTLPKYPTTLDFYLDMISEVVIPLDVFEHYIAKFESDFERFAMSTHNDIRNLVLA